MVSYMQKVVCGICDTQGDSCQRQGPFLPCSNKWQNQWCTVIQQCNSFHWLWLLARSAICLLLSLSLSPEFVLHFVMLRACHPYSMSEVQHEPHPHSGVEFSEFGGTLDIPLQCHGKKRVSKKSRGIAAKRMVLFYPKARASAFFLKH